MRNLSILLILLIFFSGCMDDKSKTQVEEINFQREDFFARMMINSLVTKDFDTIISHCDNTAMGDNPFKDLIHLYKKIEHRPPIEVTQVGREIIEIDNSRLTKLTYQIKFPKTWSVANLLVNTEGTPKKIFGLKVNRIPTSLQMRNDFSFRGKGLSHYIFLLATAGVAVLIFYSLFMCIKSKVAYKWIWIIFIWSGICKICINWTTGQFLIYPFHISLVFFGVRMIKQGEYAPWIISTAIPLGAITFLVHRNRLSKRHRVTQDRGRQISPEDRYGDAV